jgi:mannose-6-phosphate isomerase
MTPLYPLLLNPVLHTRVWGGQQLAQKLGKVYPTTQPYGESWELHDSVTVENGALAGQTIGDLLREYGADLIGAGNDPALGFPLLVKFLDAQNWLSVQVHPNDEQAARLEGQARGKTEAWVVIGARPGARLIIGLKPGTSPEQMAAAIRENRLEALLEYAPVKPGDVLFIAANTVHALGEGILIYEIQQSSDLTYRLYDWGRVGLDGQPRELHIEKGVQVSNLSQLPPLTHPKSTPPVTLLIESPYFNTLRYDLDEDMILTVETGGRFHALTCIGGEVFVQAQGENLVLELGQTALIPAALEDYTLSGPGSALNSYPG